MNVPSPLHLRKLLIFAHVPPPHHGQSYMVKQVLDGLGGDARRRQSTSPTPGGVECYHVNCRFSRDLKDIGSFRWLKLPLLLRYAWEAVWYRVRYGATDFFCVPASPNRSAIYRDWLIMLLARCCFRRRICYWQAAGLGTWLTTNATGLERWLTRRLLGNADLSIVLTESGRADAEALHSQRIVTIPNFLPDPCADSEHEVLAARQARLERLRELHAGGLSLVSKSEALPVIFRVLFLSLCTRPKGLFDAVEAVALANRQLASEDSGVRVRLDVAGEFWDEQERREFTQRLRQPDLALQAGLGGASELPASSVVYHGFVNDEAKRRLFLAVDGFCFPTYYPAESFGLVLAEAMAYELPVVATRWRHIAEVLPPGHPGLVAPQAPAQVAAVFRQWTQGIVGPPLRPWFKRHFLAEPCLARIREALAA